jgi:hypothetical protein
LYIYLISDTLYKSWHQERQLSSHPGVAERFRYLMESLGLDRAGFVRAVDGAVSEQTLYSLLNGHRRPSRALAVLIEKLWGFRAAYLLGGEGPVWAAPMGPDDQRDRSPDELAVLEVLSRSPELARTLRRDLDDAVLWSDLWQRTQEMLEELERLAREAPTATFAELAREAFVESVWLSDRFEELVTRKLRRRGVHLVYAFLRHCENCLGEEAAALLPADLRSAAASREKQLRAAEDALRQRLRHHADQPSLLESLTPETSPAARAMGGLERSVLTALERQDG